MKAKLKCVFQSQAKGCGYAAIKMALIHASGKEEFAYAEEPQIAYRAPSIADLVIYAERYGLSLEAYRVADPCELANNTEFPLLLVVKENRLTHMVYLIKKKRRHYIVLDPAKGRRKIRAEKLHGIFTGAFLCERGYRDMGVSICRKEPIPTKEKVLDAAFSFAPSLFLVAGLFCLDFLPLWVGMAFLGTGVISLVGGKMLKLWEFKQFDRRFGSFLLVEDEKERVELYTHFCAYKGLAFTTLGGFLTSFLEIASVFAMFLYREFLAERPPYFALTLVFALLLGAMVNLLDGPRQKESMENVEEKEALFLRGNLSGKKRKLALLSLFASSSSFASFLLAKEGFTLGVSVVLSAVTMALTGSLDFIYFVYYALGIAFMLRCLTSCFKSGENLDRKRREEPYFTYHFLPKEGEDAPAMLEEGIAGVENKRENPLRKKKGA